MIELLSRWQFWAAVIIISFVTHWVLNKFSGMGSVGATS